jgi:hypothetical protein
MEMMEQRWDQQGLLHFRRGRGTGRRITPRGRSPESPAPHVRYSGPAVREPVPDPRRAEPAPSETGTRRGDFWKVIFLIGGYLLFAHIGCHNDEDNELCVVFKDPGRPPVVLEDHLDGQGLGTRMGIAGELSWSTSGAAAPRAP